MSAVRPEPMPVAGTSAAHPVQALGGLDIMLRIMDGRLPPPAFAELLGFRPVEFTAGRAVFLAASDTRMYNPMGFVHGGYISTLLDTCMACAVHTRLKAGSTYTTLELSVKFVRSISMKTGEIRAEGETLHVGRQTASAQGHLTDPRASCLPTPRQRVWCSPHHGAKTAVPNFVMYLSTENINA